MCILCVEKKYFFDWSNNLLSIQETFKNVIIYNILLISEFYSASQASFACLKPKIKRNKKKSYWFNIFKELYISVRNTHVSKILAWKFPEYF